MLDKLKALNAIQKFALVAAFFTVFTRPMFWRLPVDYVWQETMIWLALIASFLLIAVLFGDMKED
jgi:hypothetical protein